MSDIEIETFSIDEDGDKTITSKGTIPLNGLTFIRIGYSQLKAYRQGHIENGREVPKILADDIRGYEAILNDEDSEQRAVMYMTLIEKARKDGKPKPKPRDAAEHFGWFEDE